MTASDIPIIAMAAAIDSSDVQLGKSMGFLTEVRKRIDLPVVSGETLAYCQSCARQFQAI